MKHLQKIEVTGTDTPLSDEEIQAYVDRGREKRPKEKLTEIHINVIDDDVEIEYVFENVAFQRIRRITGYLVGTLDRFNNAKHSEVLDRVKHGLDQSTDDFKDVWVD